MITLVKIKLEDNTNVIELHKDNKVLSELEYEKLDKNLRKKIKLYKKNFEKYKTDRITIS